MEFVLGGVIFSVDLAWFLLRGLIYFKETG